MGPARARVAGGDACCLAGPPVRDSGAPGPPSALKASRQ
jgi:hypothetical protein